MLASEQASHMNLKPTLLALLSLALIGCYQKTEKVPSSPKSSTPPLKLKIIEESTMPPFKRSVTVITEKRLTEEELRRAANQIKSKDPKRYERTFILYYLPHMEMDHGAWATTHFNPDLEIAIRGITEQEHGQLKSIPAPEQGDLLGSWYNDGFKFRIDLLKHDGQFSLRSAYPSGSQTTKKLISKERGGKTTYNEENDPHNEYFYIKDGNLRVGSDDGDMTAVYGYPLQ